MGTIFLSLLPLVTPLVVASVVNFFDNLMNEFITPTALAIATFFFAWAALLYMTSGHNLRRSEQARDALYAALTGLALALLAATIAQIIATAAYRQ